MKLKHFYSSKDNLFFGLSPKFMGAILMILWGYRAVSESDDEGKRNL